MYPFVVKQNTKWWRPGKHFGLVLFSGRTCNGITHLKTTFFVGSWFGSIAVSRKRAYVSVKISGSGPGKRRKPG